MKDTEEIKIFSENIRKAKKKLKLSHTAFAEFLGFNRDTVIKWYAGISLPPEDRKEIVLKKLKEILS